MFLPLDHLTAEHQYDGANWQDFTGAIVGAAINLREFTGAHTAAISLFDVTMDPSQSNGTEVLKEGDKVRVYHYTAAGAQRKMATFRIKKITVDIDLTKPPGRRNKVNLELRGVGITGVGGAGAGSGTDSVTGLSHVITGAPFEIGGDGHGTGVTAPTGVFSEDAVIDDASELDQIVLTRDSNPGTVVFEDPEGAIQVFDAETERTGASTWTIGPGNYSKIDQRWDASHIINVLHIHYVEKFKAGGKATRKIELVETFTDAASIAKYGRRPRKVTIHKKTDQAAYAAAVFAKNADPVPVPDSVVVPVREVAELLPGYADGAYVGNKVDVVLPDGVTTITARVSRIVHVITNRTWLVQVFLRNQHLIQRPRTPAAAVDPRIANNPDGTVQTPHLDDQAVDADKLADAAVGGSKLDPAVELEGRVISGNPVAGRVEINDTVGIQAFDAAGDETVRIESATGNASFIGELGTARPGDIGTFIYSTSFWDFADRLVTRPVVQFNVGATRKQPSIQADDLGTANLFLYSGGGTGARETEVFVGSERFHIGIEKVAGSAVYDGGAEIAMDRNGWSYKSDPTVAGATYQMAMGGNTTDGASMVFANIVSGSTRGFSYLISSGDRAVIFTNNAFWVRNVGNTAFANMTAKEIHSDSGGLFMDDLSGGGSTGANIGNGGRIVRASSSLRYKDDVEPLTLEDARKVLAIEPVTFRLKEEADDPNRRTYPGFIAEQAAEVGAELWVNRDREGRPDGIRYGEITAALVSVVRELDDQVTDLRARLAALERKEAP